MGAAFGRLRRALRRYGLVGTLRLAAAFAKGMLVRIEGEHVWYQLLLHEDRPRRELDPALTLVTAGEDRLALLDQLWALDRDVARSRLREGNALWFVLDGERPAFSCWTFRRRVPIRSAQGGSLALPGDTVCLEESMTSEAYRGRSIAPAAWTLIADRLANAGDVRRMVTAVEEENAPSRAAVEKVGFVEVGRSHTSRRGRRIRVHVTGDVEGAGAFLRGLERAR